MGLEIDVMVEGGEERGGNYLCPAGNYGQDWNLIIKPIITTTPSNGKCM